MDGGVRATNAVAVKPPPGGTWTAPTLDKRLNLRRRAREDGARNHPRTESHELSETEQQIVALVAAERARIDGERNQARVDAEQRLRALAPTRQDFTGPALEAKLALRQAAGRLEADWAEAVRQEREARQTLNLFKDTHRIARPAFYPRSSLLQAGLLFCAAVFEAMFSAALFAEDDARGLLGGAITAIGLSGANVTLGFLAGFLGLRHLQHAQTPVKALGGAAFAFFAALALMLNLFAADWRDHVALASGAIVSDDADASFHIWSLLQLKSPQAIILLMLGAGVWVFSALKGYAGFDDPYPDYGKMDRAARDATEALSEYRGEARLDLEEPIEAARSALTARYEKMRAEYEAMDRAFNDAAARMEGLDARARALDEAAASAVQLYRQENAAARVTPAPTYFSDAPPAAGPALDSLERSASMLDNARALLHEAQLHSANALTELASELDAAQVRLEGAA